MSYKGFIPLILIIILAATLGIGAFLFVAFQQRVRPPVTFIVTIPKTTPSDDAIVLHYNGKQLPLEKVANFTYKAVLNLFPGERLQYGYSRGGFHPFGEKGVTEGDGPRHLIVGDNKLVQDTVLDWKWLPKESLNEPDIDSLAGKKPFKERSQFGKGVQFVDFWDKSWPYQYTSTINHLKAQGYKWIIIAPPWDIKSKDPPEISNIGVKVPAYPDDKLREHIRIFKKAGFKVMLRPQICCEQISFNGRNDTWWKKWYDEVEDFVKYHADLARDEGVDAMVLSGDSGLPLDPKSPAMAPERWKKIIQIAKTSKALIGYETLAWGASYENIIPGPGEFIDFWDDLDFVGVSLWGNVLNKQDPTQEDFDRGMKVMLDKLDVFHQKIGKQIVLIGVAYESIRGAGFEKGPETSYTWDDPDKIPVKYSAKEQAMIYEALMRQVSDKDYIQGVFPFGYWYVDAPLTVDMSIRGKMAERILTNWFKNIPD